MLIHKGYRFRIYPSPTQITRIGQWENALRFLWNLTHEQRLMGLARTSKRYPTAFDQINELTALRAELPWLADVPRNVCAQLLIELDKAWQRCFKRLAHQPHWKCKRHNSFGFTEPHPNRWRLNDDLLRFPKLGSIRTVAHRPLEGKPKTCTIKRDGDQWFVSIMCEIEVADPAPRVEPVVALDRGVTNLVGDSDGNLVPNPKHLDAVRRHITRAQHTVARRKRGSKNQQKAKDRVARLHRKVQRQREHFLHGLSARYAKSHGTVIVERLNIHNMSKGAAGTLAEPGTHVAQKRGLNRSILSAGWGRLVEMLRYKLAWSGGRLGEVSAAYSSQECSACGHVSAENRPSQAVFSCVGCGHSEHADLNAPKVLKSRANRSAQPVEGSPLGAQRSRKRLRAVKRVVENSASRN